MNLDKIIQKVVLEKLKESEFKNIFKEKIEEELKKAISKYDYDEFITECIYNDEGFYNIVSNILVKYLKKKLK